MTVIAFRPRTTNPPTCDEAPAPAPAVTGAAAVALTNHPSQAVAEGEPVQYVTTTQTATYLRRVLRATFPGVRFFVRCARGTAHGWIDVTWTDGPRVHDVHPILTTFEGSHFDGMDDAYHQNPPIRLTLPGHTTPGLYRFECCGATPTRHIGVAGYAAVAEHINSLQPGAVHAEPTTLRGYITEQTWTRLDVVHRSDDLDGIAWEIFCRLIIPG